MYRHFVSLFITLVFCLFSLQTYAADANTSPTTNTSPTSPTVNTSPTASNDASTIETIKNSCVKEWVKLGADTSDKVAYKAFGEKYCSCAAGQPLSGDEDIKKAARLCMTRTLLHDTMDNLEESPGLKNLTSDQINSACQAKLGVIYPKMDAAGKKVTYAYCQCASPKLADMAKNESDFNDQQWSDKIDGVAADCAGTG